MLFDYTWIRSSYMIFSGFTYLLMLMIEQFLARWTLPSMIYCCSFMTM